MSTDNLHPDVKHACVVAKAVAIKDFADKLSKASDLLRRFSVITLAAYENDLGKTSEKATVDLPEEVVAKLPHYRQQFCELRVSAVARADELDVGTTVDVVTDGKLASPFVLYFFTDYARRLSETIHSLKETLDLVDNAIKSA
jgi:hypothetical protein